MKSGESFQLSAAWWKKGKPLTLKPTGLGAALTTYSAAKAAFNAQKRNNPKFEAALSALEAVNTARLKAIALCGNDHPDTKAALQRANVIAIEMGSLKTAKKQTYVAFVRQLKTRVADLKMHSQKIKAQVDKYVAEEDQYDDKTRVDMQKKINLNLNDYIPNAIQGGATAIDQLKNDLGMIRKHFPEMAKEIEENRAEFDQQRTNIERARSAAQKAFA